MSRTRRTDWTECFTVHIHIDNDIASTGLINSLTSQLTTAIAHFKLQTSESRRQCLFFLIYVRGSNSRSHIISFIFWSLVFYLMQCSVHLTRGQCLTSLICSWLNYRSHIIFIYLLILYLSCTVLYILWSSHLCFKIKSEMFYRSS